MHLLNNPAQEKTTALKDSENDTSDKSKKRRNCQENRHSSVLAFKLVFKNGVERLIW